MTSHRPAPTTARHLIDALTECGIEHLFCNLGTDHATLIEELADCEATGVPIPRIVVCPHENVAVHMAGGYAAVTGRGQAVLVHVDAGTANAAMGLHNLFRSRVPVLLMAGRSPYALHGELPGARDNYVQYVQDPFDIGSLVRPYTKWEFNLASGVVAKEVVRRAHTVMHTDPPGPVYLTLPRETLAQTWPGDQVRSYPASRYGAVGGGSIGTAQAHQIAQALMTAQHPVVYTAYLGRRPQAVAALEALAELAGVRVVEFNPSWLSISRASPWFAGFDPAALLPRTDIGLLLDVDIPWLPAAQVEAATRWIHIDVDPLKQDFPLWGFATDMRLRADCATALAEIADAVRALADADFHHRVAQRRVQAQQEAAQRLHRLALQAQFPGSEGALNAAWVCATLGAALRDDDIVINEGIKNSLAVLNHIPRQRPLTLLSSAGGGLGYSAGMALGARLACPDVRVVHVEGDGGFHFSTPTSVYAVAQAEGLPILSVVLDNGGWQAVKDAVLRMHPQGVSASTGQFHARLRGPERRFEEVAQAFGAHGERVERPEQLEPALQRCLQALDRGQAALLVVSVTPL